MYIDGFSAAKRDQQRIACCYENYLAYFLCGFLGGNESFAEIRAGSLPRLAASPLDFASALCSNFQRTDFKPEGNLHMIVLFEQHAPPAFAYF